jgi:hypothetical protein
MRRGTLKARELAILHLLPTTMPALVCR